MNNLKSFFLLFLLLGAVSAYAQPQGGEGLQGNSIISQGWAVIGDGTFAPEGAIWNDAHAVTSEKAKLPIIIDFPAQRPVGAIILQADWNDTYFVDCRNEAGWGKIWSATPDGFVEGLATRGVVLTTPRSCSSLRVRAGSGDGYYSIAELQIFEQAPANWDELTHPPVQHLAWLSRTPSCTQAGWTRCAV